MFSISKKSLLKFGLLMMFVLFVVSIVSVTDYVIQAKNEDEQSIRKLQEIQEGSAVYGHDLDQALERLAKMFGIEQSVIRNYYTEGYKIRELYVAGVIGKASGKSLEDIIALETLDKTSSFLVKDLGISRKDIKRIR